MVAKMAARMGAGMGASMGRLPTLVKFGSGLVLQMVPAVAATVIGGYLLTQLHFGAAPAPQPSIAAVPAQQEPTVGEERAAMREVLKQRRENPEEPATVRPTALAAPARLPAAARATVPASAPVAARPTTVATIPVGMDSILPNEPVARPAARVNVVTVAAPGVATRRDGAVRPRPDAQVQPQVQLQAQPQAQPQVQPQSQIPSQAEVYVPAPPPGLPAAPARDMDAPTVIVPAAAPAQPPAPPALPEPPHRGPVGIVLSTVSNFVGHAANATGHTVNWVIDLPGKAISAGGRVIGITPPPPPARPFS